MEVKERIEDAIIGNARIVDGVIVNLDEVADAVLDAMREPTEEMIDAVAGQEQTRSDAKRIWTAMIDAARTPAKES